jgi:hypothetical protein
MLVFSLNHLMVSYSVCVCVCVRARTSQSQLKVSSDFLDFLAICRVLSATSLAESEAAADQMKASLSVLDAQPLSEASTAADEIRARDAGLVGTSVSLAAKNDILEQTTFSASDLE